MQGNRSDRLELWQSKEDSNQLTTWQSKDDLPVRNSSQLITITLNQTTIMTSYNPRQGRAFMPSYSNLRQK
jgi:hypothetical protein